MTILFNNKLQYQEIEYVEMEIHYLPCALYIFQN